MFMVDNTDVAKVFGVELITSSEMNTAIQRWDSISSGKPSWVNPDDDIVTVNMAKVIANTRAKLTTLDIGIKIDGDARAKRMQKIADDCIKRLPDRMSRADRLGGMIIKWNGETWDFVMNGSFGVTAKNDNGEITGAIFAIHTSQKGSHYTRLEYHRFENKIYRVSNKAFKNTVGASGRFELGREVPLTEIEVWAHLKGEVYIQNLERPLFGYYRCPGANDIDPSSPLGTAVFSSAEAELQAIDIAISRKNGEVEDSKHMTFVGQQLIKYNEQNGIQLPRFVKGLGVGLKDQDTSAIHEHVPTMLTEGRIKDINFDLSLAGVKCGFSEGVFVLDGQRGMITATQVEADDRDTIQTIKEERDALSDALDQALYGVDAMLTLYDSVPLGTYEVSYNFGDITYSYEEDKANWKSYAAQGWVPKWLYFVKFEGMSEEEAKAFTQEASAENQNTGLFGVE